MCPSNVFKSKFLFKSVKKRIKILKIRQKMSDSCFNKPLIILKCNMETEQKYSKNFTYPLPPFPLLSFTYIMSAP